jgi:hypothetical protein
MTLSSYRLIVSLDLQNNCNPTRSEARPTKKAAKPKQNRTLHVKRHSPVHPAIDHSLAYPSHRTEVSMVKPVMRLLAILDS